MCRLYFLVFVVFIILRTIIFQGRVVDVVEKYNNYVIQNSIISASSLQQIVNNSDVKIIFIESNGLPLNFIPNTIIIKFSDIITVKNNITMLAPNEKIDKILSISGIQDDDTVIIYDLGNSTYTTKLYWTLKVYGHEYVKILNGGLNEWLRGNYLTIKTLPMPQEKIYSAHDKNEDMIATLENINEAMNNENEVILDVRPPEQYLKGHISTAINIPYYEALNSEQLFKTFAQLQSIYEPRGITPDKNMVYIYCSTGSRASFTYFVLHELMGYNNVKVYIGS